MSLPNDPFMLYSLVNMKLRDEYSDLASLCNGLGISEEELKQKLAAAGFSYDSVGNRFM
ncbi:MAG: DUF4250 domain-containing protein [Muribaculaceae bacterium]|nr:DUF4250 domain-containing protein [Muribaculaceae bacterium]